MDREKAAAVLRQQLESYRVMSYKDLRSRIGDLDVFEVPNSDGNNYQIEVQVIWDGAAGGNIRVLAAIDDGGWSAFHPVSGGFLRTPEGLLLQ